jgi:NADH-quinone oxidoreductase subunit A
MSLSAYFPILVQILLAGSLAAVILVASTLFGQRGLRGSIKDSAYECGVAPTGAAQTRFSVKFYVTAMLFILFDIEIVFLIPWVLVYRDFLAASIPIVLPVLFFLFLLVLGLFYEMKKGALEWER